METKPNDKTSKLTVLDQPKPNEEELFQRILEFAARLRQSYDELQRLIIFGDKNEKEWDLEQDFLETFYDIDFKKGLKMKKKLNIYGFLEDLVICMHQKVLKFSSKTLQKETELLLKYTFPILKNFQSAYFEQNFPINSSSIIWIITILLSAYVKPNTLTKYSEFSTFLESHILVFKDLQNLKRQKNFKDYMEQLYLGIFCKNPIKNKDEKCIKLSNWSKLFKENKHLEYVGMCVNEIMTLNRPYYMTESFVEFCDRNQIPYQGFLYTLTAILRHQKIRNYFNTEDKDDKKIKYNYDKQIGKFCEELTKNLLFIRCPSSIGAYTTFFGKILIHNFINENELLWSKGLIQ